MNDYHEKKSFEQVWQEFLAEMSAGKLSQKNLQDSKAKARAILKKAQEK